MHHTKNKGDLGVAKVNARLVELDYLTLNPNTEHAPFDLVAYKDGLFYRVQVKYRAADATGRIKVDLRSSYSTKHGVVSAAPNKEEMDIVAVFCPDNNEVYFLNPEEMGTRKTLHLNKDLTEYLQPKT